jgi:hypothetical protein
MVDTPVGKKCRQCGQNRTHIMESTPRQVLTAFLVATLVAVPAGLVMQAIPIPYIAPFVYGWAVSEVALRAGQRRRSLAMQVAAGLAALIGGVAGAFPHLLGMWLLAKAAAAHPTPQTGAMAFVWTEVLMWPLIMTVLGVAVTVSRVRYW